MLSSLLFSVLLAGYAVAMWGSEFQFPDDTQTPDDDLDYDNYSDRFRSWRRPSWIFPRRTTTSRPRRTRPPVKQDVQNLQALPLEDCGQTHLQRITGGDLASPGQFPWQALLQYRNRNGILTFECGGALVHRRYVLTAAHCLHRNVIMDYTLVSVRLGELDTSKNEDCAGDTQTGDVVCSDAPQDFNIEKQVMHPRYEGRPESPYDIALLRLSRDVPTTEYIVPICLPVGESARSALGSTLIVAGWGTTETGQKSSQLRFVAVPPVAISTCSNQLNKTLESTQICAGGKEGEDSCKGDSGGPLIETGTINNDSRFVIKGIVSFGPRRCGTKDKPGVYTRVASYTDWILNSIQS